MQRFRIVLPLALATALALLIHAALSGSRVAAQPAAPVPVAAHSGGHAVDHDGGHAAVIARDGTITAAGDVIVELSGFTFSPTVVTIEPGQTVTWVRRGGAHNVSADDGSYRSGDVSSDWETFSHTFTAAGESRYYCEQHGGPGGSGMSGMVIVQVSGQSESKLYLPLIAQ